MSTTFAPSPPRPSLSERTRATTASDHAFVVGTAIAVGLAVTVGLWVRHGEIAAATGPGGLATGLGQITALVGTYAILVQLLLMSRIAWLERAIGLDRLAVWHRWLGFTALWLLTAHVVLTTVGYAQGGGVSLWAQTRDFISHYADVLVAWVGFALLIAVAVTSVRAARRKLTRETWYFVHLYAYLAVALAFAHQLAVGSDLDGDRAARVWWVGLYLLVGGAILWWRVIVPLATNARSELRVDAVRHEADGVVSIYIKGRGLDALHAEPGQFFLWRFLTRDGWWKSHPFSLSAAPKSSRLRITVKDLGDHTHRLQHLRSGVRVFAEGPYGTFTDRKRVRRRVLLVAGGIGITPLRAMLDGFTARDDVVVLYRVNHEHEVLFADELGKFHQRPNVSIHVIAGTQIGDDHTDLLSVDNLRRGVPDIASRECFVCGPPPFINAVQRRLKLLRVPADRIHYERFEF